MRLTRVIAVGIMLSSLGLSVLNAQSLRKSAPPAEFPPASYKGKQYVDSRGCIYIRAGIDGNVTWVPRVSRSRKQVCGFQPTGVAGATSAPAPRAVGNPVIITAKPGPETGPETGPEALSKPAARVKPGRTATTSTSASISISTSAPVKPRPAAPVVAARPKPPSVAAPLPPRVANTRRTPSPAPSAGPKPAAAAPVAGPAPTRRGNCPNASAFSQQFINKPGGRNKIRCGPQSEAPVTYGRGGDQQSAAPLPPGTRVVARHVFDNRQNTTDVTVPPGYRAVWRDDRLNPHRAERTLRAAQPGGALDVPPGYRRSERKDDRLNARRGLRTAEGNAQTSRIWSNTLPRVLRRVPTRGQIVTISSGGAPAQTTVTRLSTRSAPLASVAGQGGKRFYVRVADYAADKDARATAKSLARTGLPMNLATLRSSGHKVVLAGPFTSPAAARQALKQLRRAGFRAARLYK